MQIRAKSQAIRAELARMKHPELRTFDRDVTIEDVEWMARREELLPPGLRRLDDKNLSSWLYGPGMRTQQMERITVKTIGVDDRE